MGLPELGSEAKHGRDTRAYTTRAYTARAYTARLYTQWLDVRRWEIAAPELTPAR